MSNRYATPTLSSSSRLKEVKAPQSSSSVPTVTQRRVSRFSTDSDRSDTTGFLPPTDTDNSRSSSRNGSRGSVRWADQAPLSPVSNPPTSSLPPQSTDLIATHPKVDRVMACVRMRPLLPGEHPGQINVNTTENCVEVVGQQPIYFDAVFSPTASQAMIYRNICGPIVDDVLAGINGCVLAYGQTGAGKTFTLCELSCGQLGIIPRSLHDMFEKIERNKDKYIYNVKMSYSQVYMDSVQDLFDPTGKDRPIRENSNGIVFVEGLSEHRIKNVADVIALLELGARSKRISETNMNRQSSRSHCILSVAVERNHTKTYLGNAAENDLRRTLNLTLTFVDLAGSERAGKDDLVGIQLEEAKSINKSLGALGNVIAALADPKSSFVPWRDCRLTRLLQNVLGSTSRTALIINIRPDERSMHESLPSILFGARAMNVTLKPKVNETADYKELAYDLQETLDSVLEEKRRDYQDMTEKHGELRDINSKLAHDLDVSNQLIVSLKQQMQQISSKYDETVVVNKQLSDDKVKLLETIKMISSQKDAVDTEILNLKNNIYDLNDRLMIMDDMVEALQSTEQSNSPTTCTNVTNTTYVSTDTMTSPMNLFQSPIKQVTNDAATSPVAYINFNNNNNNSNNNEYNFDDITEIDIVDNTDAMKIISKLKQALYEKSCLINTLRNQCHGIDTHNQCIVEQLQTTERSAKILEETVTSLHEEVKKKEIQVVNLKKSFDCGEHKTNQKYESVGKSVRTLEKHGLFKKSLVQAFSVPDNDLFYYCPETIISCFSQLILRLNRVEETIVTVSQELEICHLENKLENIATLRKSLYSGDQVEKPKSNDGTLSLNAESVSSLRRLIASLVLKTLEEWNNAKSDLLLLSKGWDWNIKSDDSIRHVLQSTSERKMLFKHGDEEFLKRLDAISKNVDYISSDIGERYSDVEVIKESLERQHRHHLSNVKQEQQVVEGRLRDADRRCNDLTYELQSLKSEHDALNVDRDHFRRKVAELENQLHLLSMELSRLNDQLRQQSENSPMDALRKLFEVVDKYALLTSLLHQQFDLQNRSLLSIHGLVAHSAQGDIVANILKKYNEEGSTLQTRLVNVESEITKMMSIFHELMAVNSSIQNIFGKEGLGSGLSKSSFRKSSQYDNQIYRHNDDKQILKSSTSNGNKILTSIAPIVSQNASHQVSPVITNLIVRSKPEMHSSLPPRSVLGNIMNRTSLKTPPRNQVSPKYTKLSSPSSLSPGNDSQSPMVKALIQNLHKTSARISHIQTVEENYGNMASSMSKKYDPVVMTVSRSSSPSAKSHSIENSRSLEMSTLSRPSNSVTIPPKKPSQLKWADENKQTVRDEVSVEGGVSGAPSLKQLQLSAQRLRQKAKEVEKIDHENQQMKSGYQNKASLILESLRRNDSIRN